MTGSGTNSTSVKGGQQGTCQGTTATTWSYKGPAKVKMVYNAGQLYIAPVTVMGKYRFSVSDCPPGQPAGPPTVQTGSLPTINVVASGFFKAPAKRSVIAGRKTGPIQNTLTNPKQTYVSGTSTLSWLLLHTGSKSCINPTRKNPCP
jgi:hypothetical protein